MTKGPARHRETWWWNDDISNRFSEKQKLRHEWKQGNTSKEKYLEAKKKLGELFTRPNKAERKRFGNIRHQDYQKCDIFKIAKRMGKTNQDIVGEQGLRSDG